MPTKPRKSASNGRRLRLNNIAIRNFKGIDSLDLVLPARTSEAEPDVLVMGSRNGLGKTSVLEACALLTVALDETAESLSEGLRRLTRFERLPLDPFDLLVRAGAREAHIEGGFWTPEGSVDLELRISSRLRAGIQVSRSAGSAPLERESALPSELGPLSAYLSLLSGTTLDPLIAPPLLYFHSYRKVQEGNPELGMMVEPDYRLRRARPYPSSREPLVSTFKVEVLRAMMGKAGLFERVGQKDSVETFGQLNGLVQRYADAEITQLGANRDNTLDLRVHPLSDERSFTFDGLSSGQKEIISLMFLLWHYTRGTPGIVIIDEPELHLNPEWQLDFVRTAFGLQPQNQFIMATHSDAMFASVPEFQRVLLERPGGSA